MSGLGIGEAIAAMLFIVGGAVYVAGSVVVGTTKLLIRAGKAAHDAYVRHEEERHAKIREELKAVEGRLGETALARHDTMVKAEREATERAEKARAEILRRSDEAERKIAAAEGSPEESIAHMQAYLRDSEERSEALRRADEEAFDKALTADCRKIEMAISERISSEKKALESKLNKLAGDREAQAAIQRDYAMETFTQGRVLLHSLERTYDCDTFASGTYTMVKSQLEDLDRMIRTGDWKSADSTAALLQENVEMLHLELERNQALFNHKKADMRTAADALKAMIEESRILTPEGTPEVIAAYVDEECDAAFWSEGRLPDLWREAAPVIDQLNTFDFTRMHQAGRDLQNAYALMDKISLEYKRTRAHVASRPAMDDVLVKVDDSMDEAGWARVSDPEYVKLNSRGRYEATGDPRGDIMVRYENNRGDKRTVVVRNEYTSDGQYVQHIERLVHEVGMADEGQRAEDDEAFNKALKGRLPEEAGVKCVASTIGTKAAP